MKILILALCVIVPVALAYWFLVRPIVRRWSSLVPALSGVDTAELRAWSQVHELFDGLKTRLVARLVWLSGFLITLYDFAVPYVAGVDWAPLTARLPPAAWPLILVALGLLFGYLRTISRGTPVQG